jgi:hypothetical protein
MQSGQMILHQHDHPLDLRKYYELQLFVHFWLKIFFNAYNIDESKREKIRKEGFCDVSFYKGFEDMGLNY